MADYRYTIETVTVDDSPMEIFLFLPEGSGPFPGIVLAQHIPVGHTGIENDEFTLATAQRFADHGYAVAVPFIFHWWPKSDSMEVKKAESRDDWTLDDISMAFNVLAGQDGVDAEQIGIVGHCWGGRVALLASCHIRQFRALGMFYGGNIRKGLGEGSIAPIDLVANIPCPVLGVFGNDDTNPSPEDVADLDAALSAAGIAHEFHQYDGAGHAFQNFPNPERYREAASEDAWSKVLDFLARHLK